MNTFVEEKRKAVISGLSNIEKTANKVTKQQICEAIKNSLKEKVTPLKSTLIEEKIWNKYKKLSAAANGNTDLVSDSIIEELGKRAGLEVDIKKDYIIE